MRNLAAAFSSIFYKMNDKSQLIPNAELDDSTTANALPSSSNSLRIVHFPRISEDHSVVNSPTTGNNLAYEETMHESVPCPSCDGTGRIPKDREKQLVALIPLTDKRLKPQRTTLYVLVAVVASVVVCGLCMFFLIPRSITLTSSAYEIIPYKAELNESEPLIYLAFVNAVNITNNNYVAITIVNATMTSIHVLDSKRMVGQATNVTKWTLPLRRRGVVAFNTTITFDTMLMIDYCKLVKVIYMQFDIMVTSRYLGHEEQSSLTVNQRLYCTAKRDNSHLPSYHGWRKAS